jgi:hypothetical protein
MHRRWWLVFALWTTHAAAQDVHKCVAAGGAVSYQSEPCGRNSHDAANWEAPRDSSPSPERAHAPAAKSGRERAPERGTARTGTARIARNARNAPKPSACEAAKANRDSTLERVGLKRTFDLLSRLDEQVRKACR